MYDGINEVHLCVFKQPLSRYVPEDYIGRCYQYAQIKCCVVFHIGSISLKSSTGDETVYYLRNALYMQSVGKSDTVYLPENSPGSSIGLDYDEALIDFQDPFAEFVEEPFRHLLSPGMNL